MTSDTPVGNSTSSPGITHQAARSGGAMFIAKSVRFGFILIVNFLLINLLVPADFGLIRYVLMIVGIANLLNEMGLTTAIVQKETLHQESLFPLVCISTLWGLLLYSIIFLSAPYLANYFNTPELIAFLRVGSLMIPITGITAVHRAILRREMKYTIIALIEMIASFCSAILSVSIALSGGGAWSLVAGYLAFEGIISSELLIVKHIPIKIQFTYHQLSPLLTFGIAIVGARILDYLLCNAPFFLIGKAIGKEGLGLFSVAHDIAVFPQMAINAVLAHVLVSTFSRVQTDPSKIANGFGRVVTIGSLFTIPLLLVMACMPKELLSVICYFKHNTTWLSAAPLLRWLAVMGIFYVVTTFSQSIWLSLGKIAASAGVSVIMFFTIIIAIAAGIRGGLQGIAIALCVRSIIALPLYMYCNYKISGIPVRVFMIACLPALVSGVGMVIGLSTVAYLIKEKTIIHILLSLVFGSLIGIAFYIAILVLFFRKALYDTQQLIYPLIPCAIKAYCGLKEKTEC